MYRQRKNGVHRSAYFLTRSKSVAALRVGVPLFVVAVASTLGWYSSSASKPATAVDVTSEEAVVSEQQVEAPKPASTDSINSIDASLEVTQSKSDSASEPVVETKLNINSEPVVIPEDGTVHKVIQDENGTTTVDISVDSQTNGSSEKSTSMNVEVNSSNQLESSVGSQEGP
ncbi:hypothetical protein D3C73_103340 [compost metagenome]